ncbi:hypothetical protein S245_021648, partial [Arachis hypogaea]
MFKVLQSTPPIPESLSTVGMDFLQQCFRRDPADRPSAAMLPNHPFLHNFHDRDNPLIHPHLNLCHKGDQGAIIKPQYVDHIPKAVQGNVGQVLDQKDERDKKAELC